MKKPHRLFWFVRMRRPSYKSVVTLDVAALTKAEAQKMALLQLPSHAVVSVEPVTYSWAWAPDGRSFEKDATIQQRFKAGTSIASLYRQFGRHVVDRALREVVKR